MDLRFELLPYGPLAWLAVFRASGTADATTARACAMYVSQRLSSRWYVGEAVAAFDQVLFAVKRANLRGVLEEELRASCAAFVTRGTPGAHVDVAAHRLRVVYAGPDLEAVARRTGYSPARVAELHAEHTYTVMAIGFQPGFAYLGPLPPGLRLPRRSSPRPVVAPGSVAIANGHTAVYPHESPGGWHIIGQLLERPPAFDLAVGATWAVGDEVRFVNVDS